MGWSCEHRAKGEKTIDLLARDLGDGRNGGKGLVAAASGGGNWYVAWRTKNGGIVGVVALTRTHPNSHYNWCVKYMDETMGPFYYACPRRILEMLTPVDKLIELGDLEAGTRSVESTLEWRQKCERFAYFPKVERGTVLTFDEPLSYGSTGQVEKIVVANPRRRIGYPVWTIERELAAGESRHYVGGTRLRIPPDYRELSRVTDEQVYLMNSKV